MSFAGPNLARDPFANLRPVRRTAVTLWLAAALLLAWNVAAYVRSGAGVADRAAELERLRRTSAEDRARTQTLEADLRRADLGRTNAQTIFLNRRIGERTFSWNLLLDRLGETLPRGVRVTRLAPDISKEERPRTGEATAPLPPPAARRVSLQMAGEAEDDESLLEFVDRLFAHAAFDRPNLSREARAKSGTLNFTLTVSYRPAPVDGDPEPSAAAAAAAPSAPAPTAAAPRPGTAAGPTASTPQQTTVTAPAPGGDRAAAPARSGATPARAGLPTLAAGASAAVAQPARPGGRQALPPAEPAGAVAAGPESAPASRAGAGTPAVREAAESAPRASIFGGPYVARPYASSGGGR